MDLHAKLTAIKLEFELDAYKKGFNPAETTMHKLLLALIEEFSAEEDD